MPTNLRLRNAQIGLRRQLLRLLRNEIQYEFDHSPVTQQVTKFKSLTVDNGPGEQWISLKRKFGEKEDVKIEATMFDGSVPAPNSKGVAGLGKMCSFTLQ